MKEKIYTIPVTEALQQQTECPFCTMRRKLEKDTIEFVMGASYMERDVRDETNELGFCKEHLDMLYKKQNSLGLAIILHTHLMKIQKDLSKTVSDTPVSSKKFMNFFNKNNSESTSPLMNYMENYNNSCYICNRINNTFDRYVDTFFYLWKNDNNIKEYVKNGNGFCLEHFAHLYNNANKYLSGDKYKEFISIINKVFFDNMKRIEDELQWFITKFDHRFINEPWKNSKDALPRTLLKLSGLDIENDKKE